MSNRLDAKDSPYVQYSSASASSNGKYKMWEVLNRCEKRFEDCSKMVEAAADGVWNHYKYLDSFACYLSTSSGPVNGTLYISTKRVAFCSEFPLCYYPSPGQPQWILYKVVIAVDQLGKINASSNLMDPSQKYIQVITRDSHEFWFMGFISYNKAVKTLTDALQRSRA